MRFVVKSVNDARKEGLPLPFPCEPWEFFSILYDTSTTPWTIIATDDMQPEDVCFSRDLAWVPALLNKLAE
jgi:hypothetical protein